MDDHDDVISSEPPTARRGGAARNWRIAGAGIAAVLFGLAVSLRGGVTVHDSADHPAATTGPAVPVVETGPPAPPPIRITPARAAADTAWYAGGGRALAAVLLADADRMAADRIDQDYNALGSDCSRLGDDVVTAQAYRPIPDQGAQNAWAVALGHLGLGADACLDGVSNSLTSQLASGAIEIDTGTTTLRSMETQLGRP
ncbi:hypothetical protein [Streptacidiphilus cavernicola]|uniref:Uncharacterized protein n=1 Tax=Streptacidiphilus cavernicola TaxID=3342716 RepID=A0ABV6W3E8_9ACTN